MIENIYATTISLNDRGILIIGKSGSGKSDLALRLIMNKNAILVADDRTDIDNINGSLIASCPPEIRGKLEVRGIGIVDFPCLPYAEVKLVVNLVSDISEIERFPEKQFVEICGIKIPAVNIYPFSVSATEKVILACCKTE